MLYVDENKEVQGTLSSKQKDQLNEWLDKNVKEGKEAEMFDPFIDEVKRVIPGSDQLTAEQLRSMAINLDLTNPKFGGVVAANDYQSYVGDRAGARFPAEHADREDLGELSPDAVSGVGPDKGTREL